MNDCIHATHCRLDCHLISDIANQNFYALREHARCRSIEREGADPATCLIQSMNDTRPNSTGRTGDKSWLGHNHFQPHFLKYRVMFTINTHVILILLCDARSHKWVTVACG